MPRLARFPTADGYSYCQMATVLVDRDLTIAAQCGSDTPRTAGKMGMGTRDVGDLIAKMVG